LEAGACEKKKVKRRKEVKDERDFFPRPGNDGNVDDVSDVDPTGFKII
jgi:hypothetical protein